MKAFLSGLGLPERETARGGEGQSRYRQKIEEEDREDEMPKVVVLSSLASFFSSRPLPSFFLSYEHPSLSQLSELVVDMW